MEITSYKAQPVVIIAGKDDQQTEAAPNANENTVTSNYAQKKMIINKPPIGEGRTKTIKLKGTKARVAAHNKLNKKAEANVQEYKSQSNSNIDSSNDIQGDDYVRRQELEDMIEAMDSHFEEKKKAMKDLEFIFDPKSNDTRYHEEGNMEHYTKDNEKKREALKSEPAVVEALKNIVNLYEFGPDENLRKEAYSKIHCQIAKFMRKDLKVKALERLVEQDWKYDSKDKGYMTKKELFDSIFELGDVWTPDIDIHQYVAFFQKLKKILKGKDDNLKARDTNKKKEDPYNILE